MEVHEAFVAEWLKRECLCLENLAELFQIILHSQSFTKTVHRFLFRSVFFLGEIIAMPIAVAASSSLIVLLVEIETKEFI